MMNRLAIIVIVVAVVATGAWAIQCYDCNTATNSDCATGDINPNHLKNCSSGDTHCKVSSTSISGTRIITRSCEDEAGTSGCATFIGIETCSTYCNTDGCNNGNGSEKTMINFILLTATAAASLFLGSM